MPDQTDLHDGKVFTGRHMLIIMLSFFGVIIAVNLTMAALANKSWTGLVVKNGYIASQHFNKNQQVQQDYLAKGWKSQLVYENGVFKINLTKNAEALTGCNVTGLLSRPVHENSNLALAFKPHSDGVYQAQKLLDAGRWNLEVQALCGSDPSALAFIQNYKFIVPAS